MSKKAKGPVFLSGEEVYREAAIAFLRGGEEAMKETLSKIRNEEDQNFALLAGQLGVEYSSGDSKALLVALARKHYPQGKKRGAPKKWNIEHKGHLIAEVERLIDPDPGSQRGISWACSVLAKQEPWRSMVDTRLDSADPSHDRGENLRQRYHEAIKEEFPRRISALFRRCQHESSEIERGAQVKKGEPN